MSDFIFEAINDTFKLIPLLIIVYILIELIEFKFGHKFKQKLQKIGRLGPIFGALLGAIPQCGFSVITTSLFISGHISIGTLISVYLSTSDEALPLLLSHPQKASFIVPLIIIKIIYAAIIGMIIDLIIPKVRNINKTKHIEAACCGHNPSSTKFDIKEIIIHPIIHTIKLILFILSISILIGYLFTFIHPSNILNPFSAALIGLIPNCAASVAITELFIKDAISFGTLLSGLFASAGLGILVLFKENKNKIQSLAILLLLYFLSVLGGYLFV